MSISKEIERAGPLVKSYTRDFSTLFNVDSFRLDDVIRALSESGGFSVKGFLKDDFVKALLREAEKADYRPLPSQVGYVRQELELRKLGEADEDVEASGDYANIYTLRDAYFEVIMKKFQESYSDASFLKALRLNSIYLQRYSENSLGVSPHRDNERFINLISIFSLSGNSRFYLCADRAGNSPKELHATPGSLILLRAPGFPAVGDVRPYHYLVGPAKSVRYSISLRQIKAKPI